MKFKIYEAVAIALGLWVLSFDKTGLGLTFMLGFIPYLVLLIAISMVCSAKSMIKYLDSIVMYDFRGN